MTPGRCGDWSSPWFERRRVMDGVLIFDDTTVEKPHTDENEMVSWHFDYSKGRSVKGINLLNCVYHADGVSPVW